MKLVLAEKLEGLQKKFQAIKNVLKAPYQEVYLNILKELGVSINKLYSIVDTEDEREAIEEIKQPINQAYETYRFSYLNQQLADITETFQAIETVLKDLPDPEFSLKILREFVASISKLASIAKTEDEKQAIEKIRQPIYQAYEPYRLSDDLIKHSRRLAKLHKESINLASHAKVIGNYTSTEAFLKLALKEKYIPDQPAKNIKSFLGIHDEYYKKNKRVTEERRKILSSTQSNPIVNQYSLEFIELERKYAGYFPFYHAANKEIAFLYAFMNSVRKLLAGREGKEFRTLRMFDKLFNLLNVHEFIAFMDKQPNIDNKYNYRKGFKPRAASCNPTLYNNYRYGGSSTFAYWLTSHSEDPPDLSQSLIEIFQECGLPKDQAEALVTKLITFFNNHVKQEHSIILQLLIHPNIVDDMVYISEVIGDRLNLQMDKNEKPTYRPSIILSAMRENPEKFEDLLKANRKQFKNQGGRSGFVQNKPDFTNAFVLEARVYLDPRKMQKDEVIVNSHFLSAPGDDYIEELDEFVFDLFSELFRDNQINIPRDNFFKPPVLPLAQESHLRASKIPIHSNINKVLLHLADEDIEAVIAIYKKLSSVSIPRLNQPYSSEQAKIILTNELGHLFLTETDGKKNILDLLFEKKHYNALAEILKMYQIAAKKTEFWDYYKYLNHLKQSIIKILISIEPNTNDNLLQSLDEYVYGFNCEEVGKYATLSMMLNFYRNHKHLPYTIEEILKHTFLNKRFEIAHQFIDELFKDHSFSSKDNQRELIGLLSRAIPFADVALLELLINKGLQVTSLNFSITDTALNVNNLDVALTLIKYHYYNDSPKLLKKIGEVGNPAHCEFLFRNKKYQTQENKIKILKHAIFYGNIALFDYLCDELGATVVTKETDLLYMAILNNQPQMIVHLFEKLKINPYQKTSSPEFVAHIRQDDILFGLFPLEFAILKENPDDEVIHQLINHGVYNKYSPDIDITRDAKLSCLLNLTHDIDQGDLGQKLANLFEIKSIFGTFFYSKKDIKFVELISSSISKANSNKEQLCDFLIELLKQKEFANGKALSDDLKTRCIFAIRYLFGINDLTKIPSEILINFTKEINKLKLSVPIEAVKEIKDSQLPPQVASHDIHSNQEDTFITKFHFKFNDSSQERLEKEIQFKTWIDHLRNEGFNLKLANQFDEDNVDLKFKLTITFSHKTNQKIPAELLTSFNNNAQQFLKKPSQMKVMINEDSIIYLSNNSYLHQQFQELLWLPAKLEVKRV